MQTLFKDLRGLKILAQDGVGGRIDDLFFDDRDGCIRHAIIATGSWPRKRRVVVEPDLMRSDISGELSVAMTCAEINRAPHPDSCPPVSRQLQLNLDPDSVPDQVGMQMKPLDSHESSTSENQGWRFPTSDLTLFDGLLRLHRHKRMKAHLRSVRAIIGYGVEIEGGRVGTVADVWLDTSMWQIAHLSLCLDANRQRVAVPLSLVRGISWGTQTIRLSASWSRENGQLSLEPLVAPPRERWRSLKMPFDVALQAGA